MTSNDTGRERRIEAPHPGTLIKRDYIDALGIAVAELAEHVGLDAARLEAMLEGTLSFDVDAAIRISRSIQVPAERIMRMQVRRDFADARQNHHGESIDVLVPERIEPFPDASVRGNLAHTTAAGADTSFYFQERLANPAGDDGYAGMHALWRGDRLRIFDPTGSRAVWTGPVLTDFDGRPMLPYVRAETWMGWFEQRRPADLAFGEEHAAFFERMTV